MTELTVLLSGDARGLVSVRMLGTFCVGSVQVPPKALSASFTDLCVCLVVCLTFCRMLCVLPLGVCCGDVWSTSLLAATADLTQCQIIQTGNGRDR